VLEPSSQEAKREFQIAIAMHRAGGIAETDMLVNIMFHLSAAGLWQIAVLHTLVRDTCMANLLTDKARDERASLERECTVEGEKDNRAS